MAVYTIHSRIVRGERLWSLVRTPAPGRTSGRGKSVGNFSTKAAALKRKRALQHG